MSVPSIINDLARVVAEAKTVKIERARPQVVEISVADAEQIVALWHAMQDDGR